MNKVRYKLQFNRKAQKLAKGDTSLIQIEAYLNGRRRYFSTNIYVTEEQWNSKRSEIVKHPNSVKLNLNIKKQINDLERFELDRSEDRKFSLKDFDEYTGLNKRINSESFIDYVRNEIENRKDLRASTKQQHHVMINQIEKFGKIRTFSDLTYRNLDLLESWLLKHNAARSTIANYHKRLKIYIARAIKVGIFPHENNPYNEYKVVKAKFTEIRFLTEDELNAIEEKEIPFKRLEKIKDMFLFSCYTGLAYKDVVSLTRQDIVKIGESYWLRKKRGKTDTMYEVLLLPKPLEIIEKYSFEGNGTLLPSISNSHYNSYLKELADLCGINKNLTTHVARHTFATTVMLNNGASLEVVSRTLGHRKLETTRIYGHILDKRIKDEMEEVRKRLTVKPDLEV